MEQVITRDILEEFESITQFPLISYLSSFDSFIQNDSQNVVSYYSGDIDSLNKASFKKLADLTNQTQDLFAAISLNKSAFKNYKWWVLFDNIEQMDNLLLKLNNSSRWLRSTISNGNFNPNPEIQIPFNQGQTLESVSRDVLGSEDWDNTWPALAQKNDLTEESYTSAAGFLLKANFDFALNNFKINSIVDNPIGTKILGVDLPTKLQFDTETQDFVILSPENTFTQTTTILINLKKGDNPEFSDQGIQSSLIVGSNINSLTYPTLFRNLITLFKGDDTIKTFTLVAIKRIQDGVFIDFQVESRLGDIQKITLSI